MSESVERRLLQILDHPTVSPYGNPIPGLEELDSTALVTPINIERMVPLNEACRDDVSRVIIRRIAEPIQDDADVMTRMHRIGVTPGASVKVHRSAGGVMIGSAGEYSELSAEVAMHVLVETTT